MQHIQWDGAHQTSRLEDLDPIASGDFDTVSVVNDILHGRGSSFVEYASCQGRLAITKLVCEPSGHEIWVIVVRQCLPSQQLEEGCFFPFRPVRDSDESLEHALL